MKLVVVSTLGAVHRHVISEVARVHPPALILQPVSLPPRNKPFATRLARMREAPLASLRDRLEQEIRRRRMQHAEASIARALFGGSPPSLTTTTVPIPALASPPTVDLLESMAPDVLLVTGAPILRPEIFTIPRLCAINIHYGVAPAYRGEDTLFWPLVQGDFDQLGITLHAIEKGVDAGRVFVQGTMARRGGESEIDLWVSAARLASRLAIELLSRFADSPPRGRVQPPGGRQFFRRERTALAEARYLAVRALGRTPPPAAERVTWD